MTRERLLLIGQAPSKGGDPSKPLTGRIGRRLAALAGVSFWRYLLTTERINLFDEWMGKSGKGDTWDVRLAGEKANELCCTLRDRRVLFVGRNVATAFGQSKLPWLLYRKDPLLGAEVAVIPHPSGIVLWWNDEHNRLAAEDFLRGLLEEYGRA